MFAIDRSSPIALSKQIEAKLRHMVESRALPGGAKLLSIRQLATQLAVSTNTVVVAYDRLVAAGVIDSHGTAGFFVSTTNDASRSLPDEVALEAGEEQEPVWLAQQANERWHIAGQQWSTAADLAARRGTSHRRAKGLGAQRRWHGLALSAPGATGIT